MKLKIIIFFIAFSQVSCVSEDHKKPSGNDSTLIVETILTSRNFMTEFAKENDTVYFLKSKYYNQSFPHRVNQINVKYIENTRAAKKMNTPTFTGDTQFWPKAAKDTVTKKYIEFLKRKSAQENRNDYRKRFDIPVFTFKTRDTARVIIYNFNYAISLHFELFKKQNKWIISADTMMMR